MALCSLENDPTPQNPTIHAKTISISCTEMKLCLLQCLVYLCHCGYRQFSRFLWKIVKIVNLKKSNPSPQMNTKVFGNTYFESWRFYDIMRSGQMSKNVKSKKVKRQTQGITTLPIRRYAPVERKDTLGIRHRVADVIICFKSVNGLPSCEGPKWEFPWL